MKIFQFAFLIIVISSSNLLAQEFDFKANYTESVLMVEMRDGKKLHTTIYAPRDISQKYPIILSRTPYYDGSGTPGEYVRANSVNPHTKMAKDGYIFVQQSVRGTGKSEGVFVDIRPPNPDPNGIDDSTDNYDSIDWMVKNIPNNNGRVGQWGISHPGYYTVMGMINAHPALKAASPQATTGDPFIGDDGHRNGIFRLMPKVLWASDSMMPRAAYDRRKNPYKKPNLGTNWSYEFFLNSGPINQINEKYYGGRLGSWWEDIMEHPNYDEYYQSRHIPNYMSDITVPTLNVLGWFDAPDPYGAIATYDGIEQRTPENNSVVVAGPWQHGNWHGGSGASLGDIEFGTNTADYFNEKILVPFFEYYLKDQGNWSPAEAIMYETGGNKWHHFEQWPPEEVTPKALYFHDDFKLSFEPPKKQIVASDSYTNDPTRPVPYTTAIDFRFPRGEYRILDQRFATSRPDVLVYQTDVLEEDITFAGPVIAKLITETTGTDADWFVKVIDVFPGDTPSNSKGVEMAGYQMLVGAEGMRSKYRNSLSDPEPVVANELTPITFEIRDKFHTFKKGHKIMIQVHSTWFPIYDRNPGQFMNIYGADKGDYLKTTQTIHRGVSTPSHVILPILE